jgi:hypothetical protein
MQLHVHSSTRARRQKRQPAGAPMSTYGGRERGNLLAFLRKKILELCEITASRDPGDVTRDLHLTCSLIPPRHSPFAISAAACSLSSLQH